MKLKIYNTNSNNKVSNISNKYESTKKRDVYISNNVKTLKLNTQDITDKAKINYVSIGKNVQKIDDYCFSGCSNLTCVNGSENINIVGDHAFANCEQLFSVPFMEYGKTSVGNRAFYQCTKLEKAEIHGINGNKAQIGKEIYTECTSLKSATIDGDVTENMFMGCTQLTSAYLTNCDIVDKNGFKDCENLVTVELTSQNILEESAFQNCKRLYSVSINRAKEIKSMCFDGCGSLYYVHFSYSLTSLAEKAFQRCSNLHDINLEDTQIYYFHNSFYNSGLTSLTLPNTIMTLEQLDMNCFLNTNIATITFNGFSSTYMTQNKDKDWRFGGTQIKTVTSNNGVTYKVNEDTGALIINKILCIIETAVSANLLGACGRHFIKFYNMVNLMNPDSSKIDYVCLGDGGVPPPCKTFAPATPENIDLWIRTALAPDSEYSTLILYMMNHGSGSYIGVDHGQPYSGTRIANLVLEGDPSKKIMFICDCCHAEGMAPFSLSKNGSKTTEKQSDIIDSIFDVFENNKKLMKSGKLLASSNPNPIFLAWYTCASYYYGWSSSACGALFLNRICGCFSVDAAKTYSSVWSLVGGYPYYYSEEKDGTCYYYDYSQPNKYKGKLRTVYHKKRNHNNNFNESVPIFT